MPSVSLQWGAWGGTGMAVAHNLLPRIIKSGLGVLAPAAGVAALASVLARAAPPAQLIVSPFEWPKLMAGANRVFPVRLQAAHHFVSLAQRPFLWLALLHSAHLQVLKLHSTNTPSAFGVW